MKNGIGINEQYFLGIKGLARQIRKLISRKAKKERPSKRQTNRFSSSIGTTTGQFLIQKERYLLLEYRH